MRLGYWVCVACVAAGHPASSAPQCPHACDPKDMDARGCCPAPKPSPTAPAKQAPPRATPAKPPRPQALPKSACPSGMIHIGASTFVMGSPDGEGKTEGISGADGSGVKNEHPAH